MTDARGDTITMPRGILKLNCKGVKKIAGESKNTHEIDSHWERKHKAASIKTHISFGAWRTVKEMKKPCVAA